MNTQQKKVAVAWLSVLSNTTLVIFKIIVGLAIGSVAVISEAIHSGIDLIASAVALFAVNKSGKPADRSHPFGHGKIENISGAFEALLIFVAAGWIFYEAIHKLMAPTPVEGVGWGVAIMAFSSALNWFISALLFKVGRETHSVALQADAWHLRTDVYTSGGVMVGLILIEVGEKLFPGIHFHWIDPVAAIIVALLILKAAAVLTQDSIRDLLDTMIPAEEETWIHDCIGKFAPTVCGFHNLRTRRTGHIRFMDVHLLVDGHMTVYESHRIANEIERDVEAQYPGSSVTIHVEPCLKRCTSRCMSGCLLPANEQHTREFVAIVETHPGMPPRSGPTQAHS